MILKRQREEGRKKWGGERGRERKREEEKEGGKEEEGERSIHILFYLSCAFISSFPYVP